MKYIIGVFMALLFCLSPMTARADRVVVYPGEIPESTQTNQQARFNRIAFGTALRDLFGSAIGSGFFTNLSIVPNGGLVLAATPADGVSKAAVYQSEADDTLPVPQNQTQFIGPDSTPIVVQGLQGGAVGGIGPMIAPGTGKSVVYLVEAQVYTADTANQSIPFTNSAGSKTTSSVNTERTDSIIYQLKSGTAQATGAVAPTADTGWVGVATVSLTGTVSTVTQSMISPLPAYQGTVQNGTTPSLLGLTFPTFQNGCLQVSNGQVSSYSCTSGLGSVNGSLPIVSNTTSGVATVTCPTCVTSVSASGSGLQATSGTTPIISLLHGDYIDTGTSGQTVTVSKNFATGLVLQGNGSATSGQLKLQDTTNTGGTPVKYIRSNGANGCFEVVNNAGTTPLLQSCEDQSLHVGAVNGTTVTGTQFSAPNPTNTAAAYQFKDGRGNNVELGSSTVTSDGIAAQVLGITESGVSQQLALDYAGDLGITGTLYAAGSVIASGVVESTYGGGTPSVLRGATQGSTIDNITDVGNLTVQSGQLNLYGNGNASNGMLYMNDTSDGGSNNIKALRANGLNGCLETLNSSLNAVITSSCDNGYTYAELGFVANSPNLGVQIGNSATGVVLNQSSQLVDGVACSVFGIREYSVVNSVACVDAGGDLGIANSLYALGNVNAGNSLIASNQVQAGQSIIAGNSVVVTNSAGFIAHNTTGTYPYVAGVYNNTEHIERGLIAGGTTTGTNLNFNTPFSYTPTCQLTFNYNASLGNDTLSYGATASQITIYTSSNTSANVSWMCF